MIECSASELQACSTYIGFCIPSCTDSGGVPYKQEQLLVSMSTEHPIQLLHSFSSYMGMEAQGLQPASVPKHDQLGTQLSWHAQSALPLLREVHRLFEFLVNNCWLALFTECSLLVLSYSNSMNLFKRLIDSLMEEGLSAV